MKYLYCRQYGSCTVNRIIFQKNLAPLYKAVRVLEWPSFCIHTILRFVTPGTQGQIKARSGFSSMQIVIDWGVSRNKLPRKNHKWPEKQNIIIFNPQNHSKIWENNTIWKKSLIQYNMHLINLFLIWCLLNLFLSWKIVT